MCALFNLIPRLYAKKTFFLSSFAHCDALGKSFTYEIVIAGSRKRSIVESGVSGTRRKKRASMSGDEPG